MKNILLLGFLALSIPAYAHVRSGPPTSFKMTDEAKDPSNAKYLYGHYQVQKVDGLVSSIDGKLYTAAATGEYFSKSGAWDAAATMKQATTFIHTGKEVMIGSLIGGTILGLVAGGIFANRVNAASGDIYSVNGADIVTLYGGLAGAIIGEVTGWSIYHWRYRARAVKTIYEAGNSFNTYLGGELHIEVSPMPSGGKAEIKLTY